MASNRPNNVAAQGRPLKPALASNRTAKTPLAPRLAASASAAHTFPRAVAPRLAASAVARSPAPSLEPSLVEDGATPVKTSLTDNVTPRSSTRKSRVDSTDNTPNAADDTPSHVRPRLISPTQSEPVVHRLNTDHGRPHLPHSRPKSTVNGSGKDTVRGPPAASRPPAHHPPPKLTKDTGPMFFRADQVKSQPEIAKKPPVTNKRPNFFYASSQGDTRNKASSRNPSPELSTAHDIPSPYLPVPHNSREHASLSPISPPLSSVSSRSPYFPSPIANSPSFRPPSPPKENIHLSYRKGVSQIIGRAATPSSASVLSNRSSYHAQRPHLQRPTPGQTSQHAKSQSLSSIDTGSPDQPRAPTSFARPVGGVMPSTPSFVEDDPKPSVNAVLGSALKASITHSPQPVEEPLQSPPPPPPSQVPDLAAEARRERKVLDLEISNSSLLAINKSLEREIRKQKTELKRFRRLSRAGQFNVTAIDSSSEHHMTTLDEEEDFNDSVGRPSSPFMSEPTEDYSDDDDGDSTNSSAAPLSPTAQAAKDAKHRADDEERLRLDLDRHRELLLDTQRMNKSLQRCLTWTEDLITNAKKALDYKVPSDAQLGGRILTDDDEVDDQVSLQDDGEIEQQDEDREIEEDILNVDNLVAEAMGGYLSIRGGGHDLPRQSGSGVGSGSEKDSAVEFSTAFHTPLRPSHRVEFGKPTPLRNPLVWSQHNSGSSHV